MPIKVGLKRGGYWKCARLIGYLKIMSGFEELSSEGS
jgi:hypothetical protein